MRKAAQIALKQCMGLTKKDSVLIITDKLRKRIAEAFFYEAMKIAKNVLLITIPVGKIDGEEPPKLVAEVMKKGYDIILLVTTMSLSHTNATKAARKTNARIASMPGITESMMKRCIPVDYKKIESLNNKLGKILEKVKKVRIITAKGTDFTVVVSKKRVLVDDTGIYSKPKGFGNLPAGEVCFAPLEGKSNGVFVVDASIFEEKLKKPITFKVKNGYVYDISDGAMAKKLLKMIKPLGKSAFNIAELGIGTNPKARITGNVLEDEKVLGTCHVAIGNNSALGGKIYAKCHIDGVINRPTIYFDKNCVMRSGRFLI
ncbi:MAG: aminopeptidase [Candidatus Woesearchaeota archaeon]